MEIYTEDSKRVQYFQRSLLNTMGGVGSVCSLVAWVRDRRGSNFGVGAAGSKSLKNFGVGNMGWNFGVGGVSGVGNLRSKYFGVGGVSRNFGVGCVGGLDP